MSFSGCAFRLAAEFAASVTGALLGRALMARLGLGYSIPLPADLGGAVAVTVFLSRHRRLDSALRMTGNA